jgi:hypothetical protein
VAQLPVVHLDDHFWRPGWVPTPLDEWSEQVRAFAAGDRWIIDGHHRTTLAARLERAEWVIVCDLPPWRCLSSVVARLARWRVAPARRVPAHLVGPDGRRRVGWELPRFLRFVARFRRDELPGLRRLLVDAATPTTVVRSRREHRALLRAAETAWG